MEKDVIYVVLPKGVDPKDTAAVQAVKEALGTRLMSEGYVPDKPMQAFNSGFGELPVICTTVVELDKKFPLTGNIMRVDAKLADKSSRSVMTLTTELFDKACVESLGSKLPIDWKDTKLIDFADVINVDGKLATMYPELMRSGDIGRLGVKCMELMGKASKATITDG